MKSLIYGINPYTISKITWSNAFRIGYHPYRTRLRKRKHPILSAYFPNGHVFDGFYPATVKIYGADNSILKTIECRSKDAAKKLKDDLQQQLMNAI